MSNALSNPSKVQTVFTQSDLPVASRNLLFRMKAELFDFDARPPKFKPNWKIEPAGKALLMHREIDRLNAARYGINDDEDDDDDDDGNNVVVGGAE